MVQISDAALAAQLHGKGEIAVTGPDGKLIGFFKPMTLNDIPIGISEEELQRREQSPGPWHTIEEVKAKLRELKCSQ